MLRLYGCQKLRFSGLSVHMGIPYTLSRAASTA
jgi:hypothetical protein